MVLIYIKFHSDIFSFVVQGNECKVLLKNTEKLLELLPAEHCDFYMAFVAFNQVVDSCFGLELYPKYSSCIENFEKAYLKLGLNITPKVHLLIEHAVEDISLHGQGLGLFNEAAAESIHADFDHFYGRYATKDNNSPTFLKKLQLAVTAYNSSHI